MIKVAFTQSAAVALEGGTDRALARGSALVSPNDLLAALLEDGDDSAARGIVSHIAQDVGGVLEELRLIREEPVTATAGGPELSPLARLAIRLAMQRVRSKRATAVDTGDLLLGVLWVGGHGQVSDELPFAAARSAAEHLGDPDCGTVLVDVDALDLFEDASAGVLRVLEVARALVRDRGISEIATKDLLLALSADSEGTGALVLRHLGIDHAALVEAARRISPSGTSDDAGYAPTDFMSRSRSTAESH
jgi:ATP-dependent Clp protease ATP-binding subunit ClpA